MQRYSQGIKVPNQQTDYFTGETTSGAGYITLNLTYAPRTANKIKMPLGTGPGGVPRIYYVFSLTGKTLVIFATKLTYMEPALTVSSENSGGAGADPHDHNVTLNTADANHTSANNELQGTIVVSYPVGAI
jgi:hypothetical protein